MSRPCEKSPFSDRLAALMSRIPDEKMEGQLYQGKTVEDTVDNLNRVAHALGHDMKNDSIFVDYGLGIRSFWGSKHLPNLFKDEKMEGLLYQEKTVEDTIDNLNRVAHALGHDMKNDSIFVDYGSGIRSFWGCKHLPNLFKDEKMEGLLYQGKTVENAVDNWNRVAHALGLDLKKDGIFVDYGSGIRFFWGFKYLPNFFTDEKMEGLLYQGKTVEDTWNRVAHALGRDPKVSIEGDLYLNDSIFVIGQYLPNLFKIHEAFSNEKVIYRLPDKKKRMKIVLSVNFGSRTQKNRVMKAVYGIEGICNIKAEFKIGRLTIIGDVDPGTIVSPLRKIQKTIEILFLEHLEA